MVLVDYSKGHGYSILDERVDGGEVMVLSQDIKFFENALTCLRDFADNDFADPTEIQEPVVSLSAVRAILRDFSNRILANLAQLVPVEPEEEKSE